MRCCLNEILPEFQEGSLGGGKHAAENILHYMWSLDLDLRSKASCTTYGTLTLTSGQNVVFNEVQRSSS
jgi:hypothetical protein